MLLYILYRVARNDIEQFKTKIHIIFWEQISRSNRLLYKGSEWVFTKHFHVSLPAEIVFFALSTYFSLFSLTSDILLRTWDGVDSGEEHISSVSRNSISSFELSEVYPVMLKCAEFVLVEYTKLCSTNVHLKKYCWTT